MTDPTLSFDSMKLGAPLLKALEEVGYAAPTSVQAAAFELISTGRDVIVQSRTGSGKTGAFVIPIVDRLLKPDAHVQVLTLCPTRELALQVAGEFERLGRHSGLSVAAIYGGAPMERQVAQLRAGARVVVGTPGRVLDHLRRGTLDVKRVKIIVLDEGDEMLSMGFAEELNAILEFVPKQRQGVILSATMPEGMRRIANRHLREPEIIALSSDGISPDGIVHCVYFSAGGRRAGDLVRVLELERPEAALIFCNMKSETEAVASALQNAGFRAEYLNGDMAQSDRERVMGLLRDGKVQFLVATDVAARGIDVPHLTHVINVGLPETAEVYVHRTGRTGRAGRAGTAITLAGPKEIGALYFLRLTYGIRPIERLLPSPGEERTRREADRLQMLLKGFTAAPSDESLALAKRLLTHDDAERVVASLLGAFFDMERRAPPARAIAIEEEPEVKAHPAPVPELAKVPEARPERPRRERTERGDRSDRTERTERAERGEREVAKTETTPRAPSAERPKREEPRAERAPRVEAERPRRVDVRHAPASAITDFEDGVDAGFEELRIAVGRHENLRAGDVLRFLVDALKINKRDVGRIHLRDRFTLVNLRPEHLALALDALRDATWNDRPISPERGRGPSPEASSTESTAPTEIAAPTESTASTEAPAAPAIAEVAPSDAIAVDAQTAGVTDPAPAIVEAAETVEA